MKKVLEVTVLYSKHCYKPGFFSRFFTHGTEGVKFTGNGVISRVEWRTKKIAAKMMTPTSWLVLRSKD